MSNSKAVEFGGNEYIVTQWYDTDTDRIGVDIRLVSNNKFIGEISGVAIPEIEDENENIEFDNIIMDFIDENYI